MEPEFKKQAQGQIEAALNALRVIQTQDRALAEHLLFAEQELRKAMAYLKNKSA